MTRDEVRLGVKVRNRIAFSGVPQGSLGVIDELYAGGFMVAWDLADRPLPPGYESLCLEPDFEPPWAVQRGSPLRDGFSYTDSDELGYLDVEK
jgi:hypothetical protein